MVEPDTEVVQGDMGRPIGLKAIQLMRAVNAQAEKIEQLGEDRLNHLAQVVQPVPPCRRPGGRIGPRLTNHQGAVAVFPACDIFATGEAGIGQIAAPRRVPEGELTGTEIYFYTLDIQKLIARLEMAGAKKLSELRLRDWGDEAAYYADPAEM